MNTTTSDLLLAWTRVPSEIHKKLYEKADEIELHERSKDFVTGYLAAMQTAHLCVSAAVVESTMYATAETEDR